MGRRSNILRKLLLGALLLLFAALTVTPHSFAASKPASGMTIAPFLQTVQIQAQDATKSFDVFLTNHTQQPRSLHLSVLNFGSLDETGGIVFAGSNAATLVKKYGLASWLQLSTSDVDLVPGQTATITATIRNDTSLSPGGHYGAIVATVVNPDDNNDDKVSVKQELSALVLATKVGGEKYDLDLSNIQAPNSFGRLPGTVNLRFYNPGNVHVVPRGIVKIVAPGGRVVSQGAINEASDFVLPETHRQLPIELHKVNPAGWWPSLYHIEVDYRYDGIDRFATKSYSLHYLNVPVLILFALSILILACLAFLFRSRLGVSGQKLTAWLTPRLNRIRIIKERSPKKKTATHSRLIEDVKRPSHTKK